MFEVDNDCKYQVADLFAVDIDLDTKRFVKAKLDDINLTAKEATILLWFNTIAAQHVKLHSAANWGVNVEKVVKETNPFFRRMSVTTVMYNYFGYTAFNGYNKIWSKQGLVSPGWASEHAPFVQCVNHGIKDNVWQHSQIEELVKYSEFVHFVVKVRAIFLAEFDKHKALFPGTDGEVRISIVCHITFATRLHDVSQYSVTFSYFIGYVHWHHPSFVGPYFDGLESGRCTFP